MSLSTFRPIAGSILAALVLAPSSALGQDVHAIPVPVAEVSAGYTFMREYESHGAADNHLDFPAGWYLSGAFNAEAGRGYRLWIRGKADGNRWANDSVFVQFNKSVTSSGTATWRLGTTSATEVNLEECSGCGVSGWGWQDNG